MPGIDTVSTSLCENCLALTTVTGSGVTSIDSRAFYKCSSLVSVTFGNVTDVDSWAFCGCEKFVTETFLSTVTESLVTVSTGAFENTGSENVDLSEFTALKHASLPSSLFRGCLNMNTFKLSPQTVDLPSSFFESCSSLSDLTWESEISSVTIGARAFRGCSSFTISKYFTASSIGDYAFEGTGFTEIDLSQRVSDDKMGKGLFKDCKKLTTCKLGNHNSIHDEMFAGCENLESLEGIEQVTKVGAYAFAGCSKFSDTAILTKTLGDYALAGTGYIRIDFDQETYSFGEGCFQDCKSLEWVHLGPGFGTTLRENFFSGCSNLATIEGLEQVTSFGASALRGCPLTSLSLSPNLVSWDSHCFEGLAITSLDLTNIRSVDSIPKAAFKDCKYLSEVKFGDGISVLGTQAFQGCESLRSITIPAKIVSIGVDCFRDCTSLETVTYEGISEITGSIFRGCNSLKTVNVPSNYPYDHFGDWQFEIFDDTSSEQEGGDGDTNSGDGGDGDTLPPGGIAGIVIAVLVVVGAAVFVAVFFLVIRKRRNTLDDEDDEDETAENTSSVYI